MNIKLMALRLGKHSQVYFCSQNITQVYSCLIYCNFLRACKRLQIISLTWAKKHLPILYCILHRIFIFIAIKGF